jgi:hypothetical protein
VSSPSTPAACLAGSAAGSPGFGRSRAAAPARDPIASIEICLGCSVQKLGPSCFETYLSFLASQSRALENSKKFVENLEKYQTNFVGFRGKNPTTFIILTWLDSKYF